jgi:hypothetical protein
MTDDQSLDYFVIIHYEKVSGLYDQYLELVNKGHHEDRGRETWLKWLYDNYNCTLQIPLNNDSSHTLYFTNEDALIEFKLKCL